MISFVLKHHRSWKWASCPPLAQNFLSQEEEERLRRHRVSWIDACFTRPYKAVAFPEVSDSIVGEASAMVKTLTAQPIASLSRIERVAMHRIVFPLHLYRLEVARKSLLQGVMHLCVAGAPLPLFGIRILGIMAFYGFFLKGLFQDLVFLRETVDIYRPFYATIAKETRSLDRLRQDSEGDQAKEKREGADSEVEEGVKGTEKEMGV
eukprot:TRINITY_DN5409_c0_g1::TRINITY_DN5409_c0_g1_i1::g.26737::m.26737 TRINITY_DN5409_c0_g1::TRINITY_DN5409_c0_g1_i1::g.26737  ORF type:complete len:207 (-),score=12.76 TRINITY_DN5409_c0_g1_i1:362-982(-)